MKVYRTREMPQGHNGCTMAHSTTEMIAAVRTMEVNDILVFEAEETDRLKKGSEALRGKMGTVRSHCPGMKFNTKVRENKLYVQRTA